MENILTLSQTTNFTLQTEDNSKSDGNDRILSKEVENTVGKGEIAHFSFSNCVFKRLVLQTLKNQGLFGKEFYLFFNFFFLSAN